MRPNDPHMKTQLFLIVVADLFEVILRLEVGDGPRNHPPEVSVPHAKPAHRKRFDSMRMRARAHARHTDAQ